MFDEKMLSGFNELDYAIYNTVLRSGSKLSAMQVKDLANAAHVSTASVVRFCKKAGCSGFTEFKYRYREEMKNTAPSQGTDETEELRSFLNYAKTPAFVDRVDAAFRYLQAATHILFVGVGDSGNLAAFGARTLCNVGCFSLCVDDPFLPVPLTKAANPVVVAISFSGSTEQTIRITKRFLENGSILISITNTDKNPLAKLSDVNIPYYVRDVPIGDSLNLGTQLPVLYILERWGKMMYAYKNG